MGRSKIRFPNKAAGEHGTTAEAKKGAWEASATTAAGAPLPDEKRVITFTFDAFARLFGRAREGVHGIVTNHSKNPRHLEGSPPPPYA